MKRLSLLVVLLLASARAEAKLSPVAEKYLDEGLHHLYSLDYPESRAAFRKIIEAEPDSPFGYLFEAGGIWWQSSMEYGLFKDTPTLQGLFEQDIEAALRKVDALESSKDKDTRADGHFVEGMTEGTRGQWEMMRGHWLKAYSNGRKALKHLNKCLKTDREYYDADLGLGVFDYQAAHFGGVVKVFAAIGGIHGNEKKGLELMRLAAAKGRYGSRQAAQFLASIYIADRHDYASALPHIQRLRRDFPESAYFEFIEAMLQYRLGHWDESLKLGREIFERFRSDPKALNRKLLGLTCGLTGEKCLEKGDVDKGLVWFTHAIESTPEPKPGARAPKKGPAADKQAADLQWLSLTHLYRGYTFDILGQSDEAERDYHWVLDHPDFSDGRARAAECLATSCDAKPLVLYLRAMSNGDPWPPSRAK
ncbi:MAG: tetratricopeptide repeat protein [Elusimicrobia bacterium]|nr:tetratricopeptide repeat protein [Elusimicrobiota bacterium]